MRPVIAIALVAAVALPGCGAKNVDANAYTCAKFNKSLATKGDDTAGNFINQLRKRADLGQAKRLEVREITLGIVVACRNKPGSTRPAQSAIATAKEVRSGHFKATPGTAKKKKSTK